MAKCKSCEAQADFEIQGYVKPISEAGAKAVNEVSSTIHLTVCLSCMKAVAYANRGALDKPKLRLVKDD